ncbi:MAG: hypothetical protein CM1200mP20_10810 [Pseudomonadota bacterium]|nr:MAG: hypothetical protein CM1200mP20_10810 [Pseudomonadota bacterium]
MTIRRIDTGERMSQKTGFFTVTLCIPLDRSPEMPPGHLSPTRRKTSLKQSTVCSRKQVQTI